MPLIKFLICQFLAVLVVYLGWNLATGSQNFWLFLLLQAVIAASFSALWRQAIWWRIIHVVFLPAIVAMLALNIPSWLYLLIFILLTLVFWGTVKGDVPLFLSSTAVSDALLNILVKEKAVSFADIGAGIGTVVAPIARQSPNLRIVALESAPLPWLLAYWRCRPLPNVEVQYGSLWDSNFAAYQVIFAFLSPAVMARVAAKVQSEMPSGGLFISSSFPVPNWTPEAVIKIKDKRGTHLYCYRISANI